MCSLIQAVSPRSNASNPSRASVTLGCSWLVIALPPRGDTLPPAGAYPTSDARRGRATASFDGYHPAMPNADPDGRPHRADEGTAARHSWHPQPELLSFVDPSLAREPLERLGRETWGTALD